jgi:hypothetical protein
VHDTARKASPFSNGMLEGLPRTAIDLVLMIMSNVKSEGAIRNVPSCKRSQNGTSASPSALGTGMSAPKRKASACACADSCSIMTGRGNRICLPCGFPLYHPHGSNPSKHMTYSSPKPLSILEVWRTMRGPRRTILFEIHSRAQER